MSVAYVTVTIRGPGTVTVEMIVTDMALLKSMRGPTGYILRMSRFAHGKMSMAHELGRLLLALVAAGVWMGVLWLV